MPALQIENHASPILAPISDFRSSDLILAGGKGANLGELSNSGFAVPPGFIITVLAYDRLLQHNGARAQLHKMVSSLDADSADSVTRTSLEIGDLFQQTSIPKDVTEAILGAYHDFGGGAVAVRSSATAEDLPEAAFAGQQETFLNVIGEQALVEAVRACWTSLWSERAILYRARRNVDQTTVKLAVVVQEMILADAAGVMFTANPVSGQRDELIIDANPGLGEAVVAGLVTPDHFVVDKRTRRVKEKSLGRREIVIRAKKGGGTEQMSGDPETSNTAALPLQSIAQLSKLGKDIEHHYGVAQDIEWAWLQDGSKTGKFYVLQSRPMTAVPKPLKLGGPMRLVLPMLAEMWPTRPYPLDMTTFTGAIERAISNLLAAMMGKSAPNPDEAFLEEDGVVVQFKPPQVRPSPSMFFSPWVTMWRTRHADLSGWEDDPILAEYLQRVRTIEQCDLQPLTWKQCIETLKELLELTPNVMELRERYLPKALPGLAGLWLLLFLAGRAELFGTLVSGVRTKTTETNQALEDLAGQIRSDKALHDLFVQYEARDLQSALKGSEAGKTFHRRFEEFLDKYGHRETSLTISQPAWKDQPESVLAILRLLAETEPQEPESYNAWQRTREQLLRHSILASRFLRNLFLKSLSNARYLIQIREDTHFYATMVQPPIRRICLELGERLLEAGDLDEVSDVFHLRLEELEAVGEVWPPNEAVVVQTRSLVARRKMKRQSLANKPMVDPRLLGTTSQLGEGVLLNGRPGSPGIAHGPAKIVHDVSEFGKLRAGDVLVSPVTNPAWTPLFQRAVAVVVDTGGSASHAAIVAREYGIPAVMGTMNGTRKLEDGQWITVDGSRGLVLEAQQSR